MNRSAAFVFFRIMGNSVIHHLYIKNVDSELGGVESRVHKV